MISVSEPRTLFAKIWDDHVVAEEDGEILLYCDFGLVSDGSNNTFELLEQRKRTVRRPQQIFAFADHHVPTGSRESGLAGIPSEIRKLVLQQEKDAERLGVRLFGLQDPQQGIQHVVPPELGITQPGLLIYGGDSHTSTHGAFGCLAFGIGSGMTHVVATQMNWQRKPRTLRIMVDGELGFGVTAKDLILAIIAKLGAGGGVGYVIEYSGSTIAALSMEARMTICNMSIEAGARAGMVAPDDKTYEYLRSRPHAPRGADWDDALTYWRSLPTDIGATFDLEIGLNAAAVAPMVTWGTNPEQGMAITGRVPDPSEAGDSEHRAAYVSALEYMDLRPGMALTDISVDRVFIGSCTNSRIEDLRAAAEVAKLGRAKVPAWVVPGSQAVKRQAEKEGLHEVFMAAGFEWREPGCSMCTALNGDQLRPGERCASTTNRNFRGRQGNGGRTHLMSPAMAAAAALTGRLTDVRDLLNL